MCWGDYELNYWAFKQKLLGFYYFFMFYISILSLIFIIYVEYKLIKGNHFSTKDYGPTWGVITGLLIIPLFICLICCSCMVTHNFDWSFGDSGDASEFFSKLIEKCIIIVALIIFIFGLLISYNFLPGFKGFLNADG